MLHRIAVGLIWCGELLVVGRRSEQSVLAGYDEFPGGKCEPEESPEDAVRRECLEETGLQIETIRLRTSVRHVYDHGRLEIFFYDCIPAVEGAQDLRPPFRWSTLENLKTLRFPPANDAVLGLIFDSPGVGPTSG